MRRILEREFTIISYFISFLRGNVPGGPFLLLLLLVVFTFILWYVVHTSGLLEREKAKSILLRGWVILIGAYIIVWLLTQPEAPPKTVLVVPFADQTYEGWLGEALADEVGETLVRSSYHLLRLPWDVCPAFQHETSPDSVWEIIKKIKPTYAIWGTVRGRKDSLQIRTFYARTRWGRTVRFSENTKHFISIFQAGVTISDIAHRNALIPKQSATEYLSKEHSLITIANLYAGKKKFREGKMTEALKYAVQAVAEDSSWDDGWRMVGQCWDLMDDPSARGLSALRKAIELDSTDVRNWRSLARYAIRRQQWDYAEDALRIAYRMKRRNPVTLFLLSHLHPDRLKQFGNLTSEKALEMAVKIYPGYEDARVKYAWILYNQRDFQDCENLTRDGLKINANSWELMELLAMSHIHMGKRQLALDEIQKSLTLSDNNPAVLYNAGFIYMTTNSLDRAREYLSKSVSVHGNSDGYYLLGLCAEQQGDTSEALRYYQLSSAASTGDDDMSAQEAAKKATMLIQE